MRNYRLAYIIGSLIKHVIGFLAQDSVLAVFETACAAVRAVEPSLTRLQLRDTGLMTNIIRRHAKDWCI